MVEILQEIMLVPLADIMPDPNNARRHPKENLDAIRASLERFGQVEPLLLREDGTVIAGNGRLQVMRELGFVEAACVFFSGTEEEAEALALEMNRTAELATWDSSVLSEKLKRLSASFPSLAVHFEAPEVSFETTKEVSFTAKEQKEDLTYSVIVDFETERDQGSFLERMQKEKQKCRLLIF